MEPKDKTTAEERTLMSESNEAIAVLRRLTTRLEAYTNRLERKLNDRVDRNGGINGHAVQ